MLTSGAGLKVPGVEGVAGLTEVGNDLSVIAMGVTVALDLNESSRPRLQPLFVLSFLKPEDIDIDER